MLLKIFNWLVILMNEIWMSLVILVRLIWEDKSQQNTFLCKWNFIRLPYPCKEALFFCSLCSWSILLIQRGPIFLFFV
jgi:hypothetical protein